MAQSICLRAAMALGILLLAVQPGTAQRGGFGHRLVGGELHGRRGGGAIGRARSAIYTVITVTDVKDAALAKAAEARLASSLAGTSGRVLVDADDPTATVGTGPSHLTVAVFDDVSSGQAWQQSDMARAALADLGKAGTSSLVTAGGIADPGPRPSMPSAALGPDKAAKLPSIPNIADICRGC